MEQVSLEQKETISIKTEVLTKQELMKEIYKGDSRFPDSRFLEPENGGVFQYFDLEEVISSFSKEREYFFPVIKVGDEIVGIAQLQKNPYKDDNTYWIQGISVDEKYRGNKYASRLVEELVQHAKTHDISLEASSYKDDGWLKLKHVLKRETEKAGVSWEDDERRF